MAADVDSLELQCHLDAAARGVIEASEVAVHLTSENAMPLMLLVEAKHWPFPRQADARTVQGRLGAAARTLHLKY